MPYRKEEFIENRFYHIVMRRIDGLALFKSVRDRVRFLFSMFVINTLNLPPPRNLSRWKTGEMIRVLDTGELPEEWKLIGKRKMPLVRICSFILLKNHVHILLEQLAPDGIQKFVQRLGDAYGKYFNIKYNRKGSLFETPFKAVPIIDDRQLRYVVGYITLNALDTVNIQWRKVRLKSSWADIRNILKSYSWSSYHYFMKKSNFSALVDGGLIKELFPTPSSFEKHLQEWRIDVNEELI